MLFLYYYAFYNGLYYIHAVAVLSTFFNDYSKFRKFPDQTPQARPLWNLLEENNLYRPNCPRPHPGFRRTDRRHRLPVRDPRAGFDTYQPKTPNKLRK